MASDADLARVRLFVARELDTISEYAAMAAASEDPVVKQLFEHVTREEKEHVAEGMRLLNALDADQAARVGAHAEALLAKGTPPSTPEHAVPPSRATHATVVFPPLTLTVGSLRRGG